MGLTREDVLSLLDGIPDRLKALKAFKQQTHSRFENCCLLGELCSSFYGPSVSHSLSQSVSHLFGQLVTRSLTQVGGIGSTQRQNQIIFATVDVLSPLFSPDERVLLGFGRTRLMMRVPFNNNTSRLLVEHQLGLAAIYHTIHKSGYILYAHAPYLFFQGLANTLKQQNRCRQSTSSVERPTEERDDGKFRTWF